MTVQLTTVDNVGPCRGVVGLEVGVVRAHGGVGNMQDGILGNNSEDYNIGLVSVPLIIEGLRIRVSSIEFLLPPSANLGVVPQVPNVLQELQNIFLFYLVLCS